MRLRARKKKTSAFSSIAPERGFGYYPPLVEIG